MNFLQMAYAVFLFVYTYVCLVQTPPLPSWPELYVAACQLAFFLELIRTFVVTESAELTRFKVRAEKKEK